MTVTADPDTQRREVIVIGGGQAGLAAADDDDLVAALGHGAGVAHRDSTTSKLNIMPLS